VQPRPTVTGKDKQMPYDSHLREFSPAERPRIPVAERLIVALDLPEIDQARSLIRKLHHVVHAFKIGFHLWIAEGADDLISDLLKEGKKVFIDAKMYDIENTVEWAVRAAAKRRISFVTVHYNEKVVRAAVKGKGDSDIKIFVVPLLTMLDEENLRAMGVVDRTAGQYIISNTEKALDAGCDGVIVSPTDDIQSLKDLAKRKGKQLLVATPGVRPEGVQTNDHRRFGTPSTAIRNGADYLIVGRPIYEKDDPAQAARDIIREMELADAEISEPV